MSSGEDMSFDGESSFITFKTNKTYKTLVTNKSQKNNPFILKKLQDRYIQ